MMKPHIHKAHGLWHLWSTRQRGPATPDVRYLGSAVDLRVMHAMLTGKAVAQ